MSVGEIKKHIDWKITEDLIKQAKMTERQDNLIKNAQIRVGDQIVGTMKDDTPIVQTGVVKTVLSPIISPDGQNVPVYAVEVKKEALKYDQGKPPVQLVEPLFVFRIRGCRSTGEKFNMTTEELYRDLETKYLAFRGRLGDDMENLTLMGVIISKIVDNEGAPPSPHLIEGVGKVLGFGAQKYAAFNWCKGTPSMKLCGSLYRHLLAIQKGELIDPESEIHHIYHVACEVMFLMWFVEGNLKDWVDDRPFL